MNMINEWRVDNMLKSIFIFLLLFLTSWSAIQAESYTKTAQTGFQFLSVISDARGTALAGAMTTDASGANSLNYNPAGMALQTYFLDFSTSYNPWIADINYNQFNLSIAPQNARFGVIGLSIQVVDYGEIEGTMLWANDIGYIDTDIIEPASFVAGLGYAKALSSQFSIGAQAKYVGQNFGSMLVQFEDSLGIKEYAASTIAIDFGTLFDVGFKGIKFGMSIRNFSQSVIWENKLTELPLTFTMGLQADLFDFLGIDNQTHNLIVNIDAVHPRAYVEHINLGMEYSLAGNLFIRYGLMQGKDLFGHNIGFGLKMKTLDFDYSYSPVEKFNDIQKFTIHFNI